MKAQALEDWGDDYSMAKAQIKIQVEAYEELQTFSSGTVPEDIWNEMKQTASDDWGIDFNMVKAYLNLQRGAYQDVFGLRRAAVSGRNRY